LIFVPNRSSIGILTMKYKIRSIILIVLTVLAGYFLYASQVGTDGLAARFPFKLGLDLAGGSQLTYEADTSDIPESEVNDRLDSLRQVIEVRISRRLAAGALGVLEANIQQEQSVFASSPRMIVELPGVTDIEQAVEIIGTTPELDFRLVNENASEQATTTEEIFVTTGLTGRFIDRASVQFAGAGGSMQGVREPVVSLRFNKEGAKLFSEITKENIGKPLAIFLDGELKSAPVIRDEISNGEAVISGNFDIDEAKQLVADLNLGALPVPIELVSTQSIGPSLGKETTRADVVAGALGLGLIMLFLIFWYRLPGVVASVSLLGYVAIILVLFKLIPVTLTAAGIAGFILSVGMAVDANVIIFERIKEELRAGKKMKEAFDEGFSRAWSSIRDANISSLIIAVILFWFGTSLVKGFALTFGLGVIVSMITAITVTKAYLYAFAKEERGTVLNFLFGTGIPIISKWRREK